MNACWLLGYLLYIIYLTHVQSAGSAPDDVCDDDIRHRKPWQLLSRDEKKLYVEGFQYLRKNKVLDRMTQAHGRTNNVFYLHESSIFFYWHAYAGWELETAIRNLGGDFACFAMPYWDPSLDAGLEDDPSVLNSGIGGMGDIDNNFCTINDDYSNVDLFGDTSFNWQLPDASVIEHPRKSDVSFYWSPAENSRCADDENYPMCCLKRALSTTTTLYSATEIGRMIKRQKTIEHFVTGIMKVHNKVHEEYGGSGATGEFWGGMSSEDPLFFLFHSFLEYSRIMQLSCQGYDAIDSSDLDDYPMVYHGFCELEDVTVKSCLHKVKSHGLELDEAISFWNVKSLYGAKCVTEDITVRKLYNPSDWNVVYELGPFYESSGVDLWCSKDDLIDNNAWNAFEETMDYSDSVLSPVNEYILGEKQQMVDDGYDTEEIIDALSSKSCKFVRENSGNSCWDEDMDDIEIETCDGMSVKEIDKLELSDLLSKSGVSEHECFQKVRMAAWDFAENSWFGSKKMLCNGEFDYNCDDWVDSKADTNEVLVNENNGVIVNEVFANENEFVTHNVAVMGYAALDVRIFVIGLFVIVLLGAFRYLVQGQKQESQIIIEKAQSNYGSLA